MLITDRSGDVLNARVPFYYPLKLAFLMWCFLPQSKGAQTVYDTVIRPTLSAHERKIDSSLDSVRAAAGRTVSSAVRSVGSGVARSVRSGSVNFTEAIKSKLIESVMNSAVGGAGTPSPAPSPLAATPIAEHSPLSSPPAAASAPAPSPVAASA